MSIEVANDAKSFFDFEHQGWEAVSDGYEQYFSRLTQQSVPNILDAAGVGDRMRLLDVCCGPGMIAAAALERGARATGLDFSAEVVRVARARVPGCEFQVGDAQALPFDDDSFDAVVCGYGIIHVPDPGRALAELARVTKPGGRVAVSVWQPPDPGNGFGLIFGAIRAHGDMSVPLPHGPDFFQFSEPEKLIAALEETGLSDCRVQAVAQTWTFVNAKELICSFMEGAVRARGLLLAQTTPIRATIFDAIIAGMEEHLADGSYRLPMPALIGSGQKGFKVDA